MSSRPKTHSRRQHRRWLGAATCFCGLAVAGGVATGSGGLSAGDVIPGGGPSEGQPSRLSVPETVVATGESRVAGRWLITSYTSEESASQPAGLPCLRMTLENPPRVTPMASSGFCGHLEDDFGAVSLPVVNDDGASEVMIFGVAPRAADTVELQASTQPAVRTPVRAVASAFERAKVFVLSAQRPAANAGLVAKDELGQRAARVMDASGFLERLVQLRRNLPSP
jgi:hypothetical protein